MEKLLPQREYHKVLVQAQLERKVETSILRCTSKELNSVFVKVPRSVGVKIRYQIDHDETVFVVINHSTGLTLCKVAYVTVCPNDKELNHPMRWAHDIVSSEPIFNVHHRLELGNQND